MRLDVSYEEVLPHPIDEVWDELTDPSAIADWLMASPDYKPAVGSRFRMKTEHLSTTGWIEAEVLELEPPHRMVWSWSAVDGNEPSRVTFELTPESSGTRLRVHHAGEMDGEMTRILESGWPGRVKAVGEAIRRLAHG
jgi:uncharacterized protein YndB with AHSA1/START domain